MFSKRFRLLTPGFGLMTLSALAFASATVGIKLLAPVLPAIQIVFFHFLIGIFLLGVLLLVTGMGLRGHSPWLLILRGISGTLSFFFFLRSLSLIPMSNVIVLFYTFPIFVALFSWLLFRRAIEKGELLLVLTGVIGAAVLINPRLHSLNRGYFYALLSSVIEAIGIVIVAKARQTNNPLIIHFYFCVTGGILCLPFAQGLSIPNLDGALLLAFSALAGISAQLLMNQGLKFCRPTEGSLILMSEVVFVGAGGILIFREPFTLHFIAGTILIAASGIGLTLTHTKSTYGPTKRSTSEPGPRATEV